jgi:hypothetical protein
VIRTWALLKKFSVAGPEINEIRALYWPFRDLRGKFAMAIWELAEADRADNRFVPQSHPAYMSRVQRLAIGHLSALLAFRALMESCKNMAPALDQAQAAVKTGIFPDNVDSALMLVKLQAVETLFAAAKTFVNLRWKNILEGRSDAEISAGLAPIHYAYRQAAMNSPALYRKGDDADLVSVNLADLATGFQTKSGHFLVRRRILNSTDVPHNGIDWALTANPGADEPVYRGDDFVVTNGSLLLDQHRSSSGLEYNEQIAQRHNRPVQSMPFSETMVSTPGGA